MHRGYIRLWRKSADAGMLQNHELWAFWCWCLLKASHKKTSVMVGYQSVTLFPGQFIFGRRKAASTLRLSEMTIRTCVNSLKTNQQITTKATNKYTIITIINWDTYQSEQEETNQQLTSKLTNKQPTTNQQLTNGQPQTRTIKNEKNVKNEKNIYSVLPEWLNQDLWNEFLKMRSSIKKPVKSEIAITRLLNTLKNLIDEGHNQDEIIGLAIEKCWQSFFAPKNTIQHIKAGGSQHDFTGKHYTGTPSEEISWLNGD